MSVVTAEIWRSGSNVVLGYVVCHDFGGLPETLLYWPMNLTPDKVRAALKEFRQEK